MKKIIILMIGLLCFSGCGNKNEFKKQYEELNSNDNYRSVSIPEKNPIVYSNASEIVEKLKNKESFYVYFGSVYCPWCRSVIEKAMEVANKNNIEKIYYVDIWDGAHNEILRDTFELNEKGEAVASKLGTNEYYDLLDLLDNVLDDYVLTSDAGKKVNTNEKRIFAPTFIKVVNGVGEKKTTGISSLQKKSNDELTDEIKKDEEKLFNDFFVTAELCTDKNC